MWLLVLGLSIGIPLLLLLVTICSIKIKNPCVRPAMNTRIPEKPPSLRFNQALSVGSHNSCHVANVFSGWPCFPPHWGPAQWRYTHPALVHQLEQGVRHLEIDAWFELNSREWQMFHHLPDPLSNGPRLVAAQLQLIAQWAQQHSAASPVWISLDVKGLYKTGCCGVPIKFSSLDDEDPNTGFEALEILEGLVKQHFGDLAVCVGELRRGAGCLRDGVKEHGWPTLHSLAGRFFFTVAESCWRADDDSGVILKKIETERWRI